MELLSGRRAVVTGAASPRGLGREIAQVFAAHGAVVAILDLDGGAAHEAAHALGPEHVGRACDVTDKAACEAAIGDLAAAWSGIDILVNNAGVTQPLSLAEIGPEDYDAVLDVNLRGTLLMSQAVVPAMRRQGDGRIVNMASLSAKNGGGIFGGPHYSASKAGVLGLTRAMARELAPDGVRVNAISPGLIDTDITAGQLSDERRTALVARVPMGRIGVPRDVAGCALFLASDLSAYCTGIELAVNGGAYFH